MTSQFAILDKGERLENTFDPDQVRKLKEAASRDLTVGGGSTGPAGPGPPQPGLTEEQRFGGRHRLPLLPSDVGQLIRNRLRLVTLPDATAYHCRVALRELSRREILQAVAMLTGSAKTGSGSLSRLAAGPPPASSSG